MQTIEQIVADLTDRSQPGALPLDWRDQDVRDAITVALETDRAQRSDVPKLIAGLVLWTPGAEYAIEYRSLEFSGSLSEKFYTHSQRSPQEYANARQFIAAVPGDLNDEGIVKYLDSRANSLMGGFDVWTTGLTLTQA